MSRSRVSGISQQDLPLSGCDRAVYIGSGQSAPVCPALIPRATPCRRALASPSSGWERQHRTASGGHGRRAPFPRKLRIRLPLDRAGLRRGSRRGTAGSPGFYRFVDYTRQGPLQQKPSPSSASQRRRRRSPCSRRWPITSGAVLGAGPGDGRPLRLERPSPRLTRPKRTGSSTSPTILSVYIHEQDRYLVARRPCSSISWSLPPRSARRYAVLRLEDVHPEYDRARCSTASSTCSRAQGAVRRSR